ncbi:trigger factor [Candidatus Photodesmus katoptron]|uniref:Trigger factor n=1 Tax=Candidatus Photodesmus katoptron Akat1 TaxID=1236703 RepID=S3DIU0_9GAMM|nr:trigger factor [Candidatus Photodesmus katoptron]EPE37635.1 trigger factor [Candidatus Photodesmus katoptron Akat1]KEY90645.1 trigger factor [Candidatus Photodesmus katoptron]
MQVTTEILGALKRRLNITVPSSDIENAVIAKLHDITKKRHFNGFRQGKVPIKLVDRIYGKAIRQDVIDKAMQHYFLEAVIKEKMNPVSSPIFFPITDKKGVPLVFMATFEICPKIDLKKLNSILIEKPIVKIQDSDIEEMIYTLRRQQADWVEINTVAEKGNRAIIDCIRFIDNQEIEDNKIKNFSVEIGIDHRIPNLGENIIGKKAGMTFNIETSLPAEHFLEDSNLKCEKAKFQIKIKKVEACKLPEMNSAFFSKFGILNGGLEALKIEVYKNMKRELKQAIKESIKEQIVDGLMATNELNMLPKVLVDKEVSFLRHHLISGNSNENNTVSVDKLPIKFLENKAKRRVISALILSEVIKSEELKVDKQKVQTLMEELSIAYENPLKIINHYKNNEQIMANIHNLALEEQVIEFILTKATVLNKNISFNQIMNR